MHSAAMMSFPRHVMMGVREQTLSMSYDLSRKRKAKGARLRERFVK